MMEIQTIPGEGLPGYQEMQRIVDILPAMNVFEGPWIAGGAVRRMIDGEPLSKGDIDVFFGTDYPLTHHWHDTLKAKGTEVFKSAYATTYEVPLEDSIYRIQLIARRGYHNPISLFKDFDFTVCQMSYDGKNITASTQGLKDHADKRLTTSEYGKTNRKNLVNRALKYICYGFMPAPGFLEKTVKLCLTGHPYFQSECKNTYDWDKDDQETIDLHGF